jgi:hypothetical protein
MSYQEVRPRPTRLQRAMVAVGIAISAIQVVAKTRSRPIRAHLQEHAYTLVGFGCVSAACFLHSVFTGLLVTGILVIVFEWKVSD